MSVFKIMHNRESLLAVFCCLVFAMAVSGCGKAKPDSSGVKDGSETDMYTLEVTKDRKQKDLSLLKSPNTPILDSHKEVFLGLDYYPPDKAWAFQSILQRLDAPEEVTIETSKDRPRTMLYIGDFPFRVNGSTYRLRAYAPKDTAGGNYWFIPFMDATNGKETYSGGRFIDIEDTSSDTTFIDFNYAYNPYCAYNHGYDCPIPPEENRLNIEILAGEKNYPLAAAH